jgi:hypothetical protein
MLMDGEFVPLRNELSSNGIVLNTTAANEHVPKIERQIRVIKERVRATRHTLPFKVIPLTMLISLVYSSILWINAFPPKGGVSNDISPRNIMTGIQFDYNKHCQLPFGAYVQAHQEPSPTNTQAARTVGAICLGPTGNIQGSYKFLNLRTARLITRRRWTTLPMPQEVIDRVNQLGKAEGQPELLNFYDRKGRLIGDSEIAGVPSTTDTHPTTDQDDNGLGDLNTPDVQANNRAYEELQPTQHDYDQPDQQQDSLDTSDQQQPHPVEHTEHELHTPLDQIEPEVTNQPMLDPGATPIVPERRSLRVRSKPQRLVPTFGSKTYQSTTAVTTHLVHPDEHMDQEFILVAHYIMTQYSMKAGMKKFKERAEEAVSKELSQLHHRDTFEPVNPSNLSNEERKQVLESHLFLKEKRDASVKGRMVAGGNKQRGTIDKQDASSPTAALESVLITPQSSTLMKSEMLQ